RGLRVGGPYTITITRDGQTETRNDVYLSLSEANSVDAQVGGGTVADATNLDAVRVTASREISVFSPDKVGAGTVINREQIESLPTINRNLQDIVRLDPRVAQTDKARNEISVGGQNTRYNSIRVDGISTNDAFGLESNGLPTPRQPFSLDTIDEVAIDVANYDVSISGGAGGVINAVTKSGTNDFHGSVYGLYRDNDDFVRKNENGSRFSGFEDEQTYGGTFGGALIKDRLFFFVNYEKFEQGAPGPTIGPIGSNASTILNIQPADIARIQSIAQGYGFDAGSATNFGGADTISEEYGLKIDWNITDDQRASFRYGNSDQSVAIYPGFGTASGGSIALGSYGYQRDFEFKTYVAQLYSNWTENFSTEAKLSYRDYSAVRTPISNLPAIAITVPTGANSTAVVNLGTEENTHANTLETETYNAFFAGTYYTGDHEIKFGFDYEDNDVYNLFGRRSNGVYNFASIDAFRNGAPLSYRLFYPTDGDINNTAAIWSLQNLGLFLQDTWSVNDNLTVTLGIRADLPMIDDEPTYNAAAQAAFGFDNSRTIDGNNLYSPRFGFNYTFDSELSSQLRGGVGLFQGAAANVWLSNAFTNTGARYVDYNFSSIPAGRTFGFDPDPANQLALVNAYAVANGALRPGVQALDFIDPSLGQPSVWKANLAFDKELPLWGMVASAEVVLTQVKEAIYYQNLNLGAPTTIGQDGRVIFWNNAGLNPNNWNRFGENCLNETAGSNCTRVTTRTKTNANAAFGDAIIARPTSKGRGEQLTVSLQKPYGEGDWYWQLAYTYTSATEVSPLTSSTSGSNYSNNAIFQANENLASTSSYEIRDRISGLVSWKHAFFGDNETKASLFYEGRSGKPYSYTFDNDANGDFISGNDLLYVPNGPGDVIFRSAAEEAAFFRFINGNDYLASRRGQVVERNGARSSWVNQFDLHISQELPGFFSGNKAELFLDILNIGNLINKDWGQIEEIGFPLQRGIVEFGGIDPATGKYVYRFNTPDAESIYDTNAVSRWSAQIGFKYSF
ncbi:MAG: TonB-dependent receptor plug domain-containing protein, partial [Burkholderiales bacterium]